MNAKMAAYAQLAASAVIIGSSVVAGKWAAARLPVFLSQGISLTLALAVLLPLMLFVDGKWPVFTARELLLQAGQAFLGMFLFRVLMLTGLRYTSAIDTGLVTSTTPAAVALLSFLVLRERFTAYRLLGVLCCFLGVAVLQLPYGAGMEGIAAGEARNRLLGLLLIFLAVLGEAMLTVLRKLTPERISPFTGSAVVTLLAWLMFLPAAMWELRSRALWSFSAMEWGLMSYYGIIVTAGGYLLWFLGVARVSGSTAAVFSGCIPVSTLILSDLLLNEAIRTTHILGIGLVLAGIGLHSLRGERAKLRSTNLMKRRRQL